MPIFVQSNALYNEMSVVIVTIANDEIQANELFDRSHSNFVLIGYASFHWVSKVLMKHLNVRLQVQIKNNNTNK